MAMTPQEKRVRRLERKFDKMNDQLREFEEDNCDVLDEFRSLVSQRETALKELEIAVRETRIAAAGMTTSIVPKRVFDGRLLYEYFEDDPDVRDNLIKVEYRVDTKVFDQLQRMGHISPNLADSAVSDVKETVRVNSRPKSFQLA